MAVGRYKALLIGVPEYDKDQRNFPSLPFIGPELEELATALGTISYQVKRHPATADSTRGTEIRFAIERFFGDAKEGDQLLLFLSGHGVNTEGKDFLIPSDARSQSDDFFGNCVKIDFSKWISASRAMDVIIMVDSCREGVHLGGKAPRHLVYEPREDLRRMGSRRIVTIFACAAGGTAYWAKKDDDTCFSLFTRSFTEIVRDDLSASTVAEVIERVQDRLDLLADEYGRRRQRIRPEGDFSAEITLLPRAGPAAEAGDRIRRWTDAVKASHIWWSSDEDARLTEACKRTAVFVAGLAQMSENDKSYREGDPWRDDEFAVRASRRLNDLVDNGLRPESFPFGERAVLAAFPFCYQAYRDWLTARARPTADPDTGLLRLGSDWGDKAGKAGFTGYRRGHGSLSRRLAAALDRAGTGADNSGRPAEAGVAVAAIDWWLFHCWLARQLIIHPDLTTEFLTDPRFPGDQGLPEIFGGDHLRALLQTVRADVALPGNAGRLPADRSQQPELPQQERPTPERTSAEPLTRLLALLVRQLAIEITSLPDVVAEHLGIRDSIDLDELRTTVQGSKWNPRGTTWDLTADCRHPAVDVALREYVSGLDHLAGALTRAVDGSVYIAPQHAFPARVTPGNVGPLTENGVPVYDARDPRNLRFTLADDRMRELLTGTQLYGDPSLAIRELYQNALDACRYLDKRLEYLRETQRPASAWSGRIAITQGIDENGYPYLDCADNGIGMGIEELSSVFSQAGTRFADLREYIEEQAAWAEQGIHHYPNSRFGIGVLSYFMLADEITVTTCRADKQGRPGDVLQVRISSPGTLFRVQVLRTAAEVGAGVAEPNVARGSGTTVRLHLRPDAASISCTDLLRIILWISDYTVTAKDHRGSIEWRPDELSDRAPVGADVRGDQDDDDNFIVKSPPFIVASHPLPTAESRRTVTRVDPAPGHEVWWCDGYGAVLADGLVAGGPAVYGAVVNLSGPDAPNLTIDRKSMIDLDIGVVTERVLAAVPALTTPGASVLTVGWLADMMKRNPRLADIIGRRAIADQFKPWRVAGYETAADRVGCLPTDDDIWSGRGRKYDERVLAWRLKAWAGAGLLGTGVTIAADVKCPVALPQDLALVDLFGTSSSKPVLGELMGAALTGRAISEVNTLLTALGYTPPIEASQGKYISLADAVYVAAESGVPLTFVREQAISLGFDVESRSVFPDWPKPGGAIILAGLKFPPAALSAAEVAISAVRNGIPVTEMKDQLLAYQYQVPELTNLLATVGEIGQIPLSRDRNGTDPWIDPAEKVSIANILAATGERRSLAQARELFAAWGFTVPDLSDLPLAAAGGADVRPVKEIAEFEPARPRDASVLFWGLGAAVRTPDMARLPEKRTGSYAARDPRAPVSLGRLVVAAASVEMWARTLAESRREASAKEHLAQKQLAEAEKHLAKLRRIAPNISRLPTLTESDLRLLSRDLNGKDPCISPDQDVTAEHIIAIATARFGAAGTLHRFDVPRALARLRELGMTLPSYLRVDLGLDTDSVQVPVDQLRPARCRQIDRFCTSPVDRQDDRILAA